MSRQSITLRNEDDLLALIPCTLGFLPEDSLVLVTLGRDATPFHARIDLPELPDDLPGVVAPLVAAARRNSAAKAMVVVYTDDRSLAERAADLLVDALSVGGVTCLVSLRADGRRWYPLGLDEVDPRALDGVAYDTRDHELTSRAVLEGRVTFRNRSELADSLSARDLDQLDEVRAAYTRLGGLPLRVPRRVLAAEAAWLTSTIAGQVHGGATLTPEEVARVLRAVARREIRDVTWCVVTRQDAASHVRVWCEVVRRSPPELVAPAAGLLAFAAWLSGDGALAWCAVDRSLTSDPGHTLARLVAQALEGAVPPSSWHPLDPAALDLHAG